MIGVIGTQMGLSHNTDMMFIGDTSNLSRAHHSMSPGDSNMHHHDNHSESGSNSSRNTGHEFSRRSPRLGRSPSLMRASSHKLRYPSDSQRRRRNRLSDSDCTVTSADTDEHRAFKRSSSECRKYGKVCDHNIKCVEEGIKYVSDSSRDMALSAVMMSGGGAPRKFPSKTDVDSEDGHANAWTSDRSRSSSPRCICDRLKSKETVMINVGGQVFETFKSTLKRLKSCKLAKDSEMSKYWRAEKGDYFFDRDPYAFSIILNYLRYGDLHLPTNLCGPALMREFQFWGVDEQDIERCCFQPYNTWKTQTKSLEKLEYDRKQSTTQSDLSHDRNSKNVWRRCRSVIWPFLQDPNSSKAAKIYAWISIIFVFMSIFSFCAETHPFFKLPPSEVHDLQMLYKIFTLEDSKIIRDSAAREEARLAAINNATNTTNSDFHNSTSDDSDEERRIQHPVLLVIDLMCVFFFSLEFLTRLVFCPKKRRFCTSLQNIIDFVAIVPDYVEFLLLLFSPSVRQGLPFVDFIFILRMLRLCRVFRLIRHVPGLWILLYTLKASFNELLLMFVFLLIGMVMFASLLHFIEGGNAFSNIPVGFWWAVVTMTTVGYGDMFPVTGLGYIIGSICAISGLLMIAFTVPIIVSNFVLYYTHVQYGISDKDVGSRIYDINDDIETCSFHTTYTETSEDQKIFTTSKETSKVAQPVVSTRTSLSSRLGSEPKAENIPMEETVEDKSHMNNMHM